MRLREITDGMMLSDAKSYGAPAQPLTPQQLQVKSLDQKAKQYKDKAQVVRATQRAQKAGNAAQKAQANLTQKSQKLVRDQQASGLL